MRTHPLQVTAVRFVPASPFDQRRGLVGYIRLCLGGVEVDGVTLRRSRDGRRLLSFPSRRDAEGRSHPYLRFDDRTRRSIEQQVFAAIGLQEART